MIRWMFLSCICLMLGTSNAVSTQEQQAVNLAIFRDSDTFTLFIPATEEGQTVSLSGLTLETGTVGQSYPLASFQAFVGLPFLEISPPICLHLRRIGSETPLPMICQGIITIRQELADFDVF